MKSTGKRSKTNIANALSIAVCAYLGGSLTAYAQDENGFTVTPMVGLTTHDSKRNVQDSTTGTIAIGYKFDAPFALELAYQVSEQEIDDLSQVGLNTDITTDQSQVRLDGLMYGGDSSLNVRPFLLAGLGNARYKTETDGVTDEGDLFNWGVGARWRLSELLALRGDIRHIHFYDLHENDFGLNLGLRFLFGGKSSGAAAKPAVVAKTDPVNDDVDGDGVVNRIDNCPSTPAGVRVDATGCMVKAPTDTDSDGVVDADDECPDTNAGAKVDAKGCYIVISEDVTVELKVNFANNSDEIVSGGEQIANVADFMKENPLTRVEIEGYTDSRGSAEYNKALSQRRASAVAETLSSAYGIDSDRVTAIGYGEDNPVASNDTAEGRAENRRVTAVVKATVEKVLN